MSTQIQRRRGTTVEHSTFTGAVGETTVDTDKDVVVVHDGTTLGGHPLAKESWIRGLFRKTDPTIVAWTKTGNGTATTSSILYIEVNGSIKTNSLD